MFEVPLSHDEIADIHAAYRDCAMRPVSNPKRKPFRPLKMGKKKTELTSCNNAIEIIYHDEPYGSQLVTDQLYPQEHHVYPTAWSVQWDTHTQNENDEHALAQHDHQP